MVAQRLLMRKLREILRLKYEAKLPHRAIGRACAVGVGTVSVHVKRAQEAGLTWPLPEELDDAALEARLFRRAAPLHAPHPLPDLPTLHQELRRPGVTLHLLWLEYLESHPEGYRYSQFCELDLVGQRNSIRPCGRAIARGRKSSSTTPVKSRTSSSINAPVSGAQRSSSSACLGPAT